MTMHINWQPFKQSIKSLLGPTRYEQVLTSQFKKQVAHEIDQSWRTCTGNNLNNFKPISLKICPLIHLFKLYRSSFGLKAIRTSFRDETGPQSQRKSNLKKIILTALTGSTGFKCRTTTITSSSFELRWPTRNTTCCPGPRWPSEIRSASLHFRVPPTSDPQQLPSA